MSFMFLEGRCKKAVRPTYFNGRSVRVDLEETGMLTVFEGDEKEMLMVDDGYTPIFLQRAEGLERGDTVYAGRLVDHSCWRYIIVHQQTGPEGVWFSVELAEGLSNGKEIRRIK